MAAANIGDFLFEIGTEELPAGQILNISNHIKSKIQEVLAEAEIPYKEFESEFTPRRLFFCIRDLSLEAEDKELEIKGPPEKIAKAEDGSLTQAGQGFLKKNQLTEADIFWSEGYLCAKKTIQAEDAVSVLTRELPGIVENTPGTRFMRWANNDVKFARPVQWVLALIATAKESKVLDIKIAELKAADLSYGHRFLAPQSFRVKDRDSYYKNLEAASVVLKQAERKQKIEEDANALAASIEASAVITEDLLDELSLITELPQPILCDFDQEFLEIPDCVLKTVMVQHQRYIPLEKDGELIAKFIAVSNNNNTAAKENIKLGNEKVIVPRFRDAQFFVTEDMKLSLEDRLQDLARLNFLKGDMRQKADRLVKIAQCLSAELKLTYAGHPYSNETLDAAFDQELSLAAKLAKADLNTNLVFEFTELQGEIGAIYAVMQGHGEIAAKAIEEHYRPRFAEDEEPQTLAGKILAIADKIDNIVCAFALGKIPSGSADPFALRRQANGLLQIMIHGQLIINLEALIARVIELQQADFGQGDMITKIKGRGDKRKEIQVPELNWDDCQSLVQDFIYSRLDFVFAIYHDDPAAVNAVISSEKSLQSINRLHMMVHLLTKLRSEDGCMELVEAVTRIINIAKSEKDCADQINEDLFETGYEREFFTAVQKINLNGKQDQAYEPLLSSQDLLTTVKPINDFFDNVLVNTEDEKLKANRKALVSYASKVFGKIGDFSLLK